MRANHRRVVRPGDVRVVHRFDVRIILPLLVMKQHDGRLAIEIRQHLRDRLRLGRAEHVISHKSVELRELRDYERDDREPEKRARESGDPRKSGGDRFDSQDHAQPAAGAAITT